MLASVKEQEVNSSSVLRIRLLVRGSTACFRRPEFIEDFVSYDVMPPFVAVRMLRNLYLPQGSEWVLRSIDVMNPITFETEQIVAERGPRRALVLKDVSYLITADLVGWSGDEASHLHDLYEAVGISPPVHLGLENYPATLELADESAATNGVFRPMTTDLGWMLYELRAQGEKLPSFFRAQLCGGRLDFKRQLIVVR